jgi:protein-S-isoprenylcysteine O-methyltransferase Ste14
MRWAVFILLLLAATFSLAAFVPAAAGRAQLLWPFAADSRPIAAFVGGLPGQPGGVLTSMLAGVAVSFFLAAVVGLFWKAVPVESWPGLVIVAASASLLLHVSYLGTWMLAPILVDAVLVWGVMTRRWTAEALPARALRGDAARIHPLLNIPVPWVYLLAYVVGLGLQYVAPLTIHSTAVLSICRIAGIVLLAGGALLAFSGLGIFRAARTTTVPFETPSTLVTRGPYRFTRNPMYLGLALLYVGMAGIQALGWPVIAMLLLVLYVDRVVIPAEESRLRKAFGDAYERYCARVRRWI